MNISPIIEIDELINIHKNRDLLIFDLSNHNQAKVNYETEHLKGAFFFFFNTQLANIQNDFAFGGRHPLPDIKNFAKTLADLGIDSNNHVVIYDDKNGANAAARFWWMLKSAGHKKVQVLNGGFEQAKKHQFPLSSGSEVTPTVKENYPTEGWKLPTVGIDQVARASQDPNYLIVDVREKQRFDGVHEPIDLIAGHIPNAINIPFTENLSRDGTFLHPEELKKKYTNKFASIQPENIILHCGSGVTACHTLLALAYAEMEIPKLYVGSWSEWSRKNNV